MSPLDLFYPSLYCLWLSLPTWLPTRRCLPSAPSPSSWCWHRWFCPGENAYHVMAHDWCLSTVDSRQQWFAGNRPNQASCNDAPGSRKRLCVFFKTTSIAAMTGSDYCRVAMVAKTAKCAKRPSTNQSAHHSLSLLPADSHFHPGMLLMQLINALPQSLAGAT